MLRILSAGGCALLLCGCQSLPSQPAFSSYLVLPPTIDASAEPPNTTSPQFKSAVFQAEPSSCKNLPAPPTKPTRNACIVDLMTDIDDAYDHYEISVNNAISRTNAGLSIAQSAFSISGTAASGTAATVLNSLGTFTGNVKTTITDEVLYKTTIQILISTMRADRAKQAAQIRLSMQSEIDNYSMNQARNDLLAYFYAGTVTHALSEANNNAAADAKKCEAADKAVKAAVAQGATPKAVAAADGGKESTTSSAASTTTSDQCNELADSVTFKADTSTTSADLLTLLAPKGVYSKSAEQAMTACVKSMTAPAGFKIAPYTLKDGSYDLGSLIADGGVDPKYKAQILTCTRTGLAKKQAPAARVKAKAVAHSAHPKKA